MKSEIMATDMVSVMKRGARRMWMLKVTACLILHASCLVSCSESEDEEADEYANWQQRNEAFFATLEDSLAQASAQWKKLKSYSKDESVQGKNTDYVYAKVIESGTGDESPKFTDSVRVSYQGRLIPSRTYPAGRVFDGTAYGLYDSKTNASVKYLASSLIVGWTTALQYMHRGDHWRLYIPYELGYGTSGSTNGSVTIPGYSTLIFDVELVGIDK